MVTRQHNTYLEHLGTDGNASNVEREERLVAGKMEVDTSGQQVANLHARGGCKTHCTHVRTRDNKKRETR